MKTISTIIVLLISFVGFSQNNCSKFYPFDEGTTSEITFRGKNDRVSGVVEYTIQSVSSSGGADIAIMKQKMKDKRGREILDSEYKLTCSQGSVKIDFNSLYNPSLMPGMEDMDVEATGTDIDLPNNLSVGQTLPDGGIEVKMNLSGINMNINTYITDREVIGTETVTTPAGTFDCFIISSSTTLEMAATKRMSNKQWIAEGVGLVKSEDYNRNGRLVSSGLLTAFSR